jgi:hypothetical protein
MFTYVVPMIKDKGDISLMLTTQNYSLSNCWTKVLESILHVLVYKTSASSVLENYQFGPEVCLSIILYTIIRMYLISKGLKVAMYFAALLIQGKLLIV